MPDGATAPEPTATYAYAPRVSLVCPKCGGMSVVPFAAKHRNAVEYAGVCGAVYAPHWWCDAVLTVRVSSHLFPA